MAHFPCRLLSSLDCVRFDFFFFCFCSTDCDFSTYLFRDKSATEKKGWFSGLFNGGDDDDDGPPQAAAAASPTAAVVTAGKVFGRALSDLISDQSIIDADGVPKFLKVFCAFLLQSQNATQVGLFRLSGQKEDVEALKKQINSGEVPDISAMSPHTVAGVMKIFFREHPDPLMTFNNFDTFVDLHRKSKTDELVALARALPTAHQALADYLFRFLFRISMHEAVNKMSPSNLGIVFAPNILRPRVETYESVARDTPATIAVIKALIEAAGEQVGREDAAAAASAAAAKPASPPPLPVAAAPAASASAASAQGPRRSSMMLLPAGVDSGDDSDDEHTAQKKPSGTVAAPPPLPVAAAGRAPPPPPPPRNAFGGMGKWAGSSAAGSFPDHAWWQNPQYRLTVRAPRSMLRVKLTQDGSDEPQFAIGVTIIQLGPTSASAVATAAASGASLRVLMLREDDTVLVAGPFQQLAVVNVETAVTAAAGTEGAMVLIIPSTRSQNSEGSFNISVSSDAAPSTLQFETVGDLPLDRSEGDGWWSQELRSAWKEQPLSAGGCFPNFTTWRANPQFIVRLPELSASAARAHIGAAGSAASNSFRISPAGQVEVRVLVQLQRLFGDDSSTANGFYVFANSGPAPLEKLAVADADILLRSDFVQAESVSGEIWLPSLAADGKVLNHLIVPSTFESHICGDFALRLYCPLPLSLELSDVARRWPHKSCTSAWNESNAGGCRNFGSWAENPQFVLTFDRALDAPGLVTLAQHPAAGNALMPVGFYVINRDGETVGKGAFMHAPEVTCQVKFQLASQPYLIVPCTFEPKKFADFTLSVYASQPVDLVDVAASS
jgi:hypothetical protein